MGKDFNNVRPLRTSGYRKRLCLFHFLSPILRMSLPDHHQNPHATCVIRTENSTKHCAFLPSPDNGNVLIGLTLVPENTNLSCLFKSPMSLDASTFFDGNDNAIYNPALCTSQTSSLTHTHPSPTTAGQVTEELSWFCNLILLSQPQAICTRHFLCLEQSSSHPHFMWLNVFILQFTHPLV